MIIGSTQAEMGALRPNVRALPKRRRATKSLLASTALHIALLAAIGISLATKPKKAPEPAVAVQVIPALPEPKKSAPMPVIAPTPAPELAAEPEPAPMVSKPTPSPAPIKSAPAVSPPQKSAPLPAKAPQALVKSTKISSEKAESKPVPKIEKTVAPAEVAKAMSKPKAPPAVRPAEKSGMAKPAIAAKPIPVTQPIKTPPTAKASTTPTHQATTPTKAKTAPPAAATAAPSSVPAPVKATKDAPSAPAAKPAQSKQNVPASAATPGKPTKPQTSSANAQAQPTPASPPTLDLDALSRTPSKPNNRPAINRSASLPSNAQTASASETNAALGALTSQLQRLWSPNCDVPGGNEVIVKIAFTIGQNGRVSQGPEWRNPLSNSVYEAAASRAMAAVKRGEVYSSLPDTILGKPLLITFDASRACAGRN